MNERDLSISRARAVLSPPLPPKLIPAILARPPNCPAKAARPPAAPSADAGAKIADAL